MSIQLSDAQKRVRSFSESSKDLIKDGTFVQAAVLEGIWIMYTYKNFNDEKNGGEETDIKILDTPGSYDISTHNGSMYLLSSDINALTLFKYFNFGGVSPDPKAYVQIVYFDITKDFPKTGSTQGASSGIVGNGATDWDLFEKVMCAGPYHTLMIGQRCKNFSDIGIDSQVKSIRKKY